MLASIQASGQPGLDGFETVVKLRTDPSDVRVKTHLILGKCFDELFEALGIVYGHFRQNFAVQLNMVELQAMDE